MRAHHLADAKCNIGVNGTDGHGNACQDGIYCCYCFDENRNVVPCNHTLGRENVKEEFGRMSHGECYQGEPDYECWRSNLPNKLTNSTPGWWYSSYKVYHPPPVTSSNGNHRLHYSLHHAHFHDDGV